MLCLLALLLAPLQAAVDRVMAGTPGAAAVMDVRTGRILARHGLEDARAVSPGSAVKPFTLHALLEAGKTASRPCERVLRISGRNLDCTHPAITGPMEAASALAYSCNCFFAAHGARLDPGRFARDLQSFGLAAGGGRIEPALAREDLQLEALGERGIEVTPLGLLSAYRRLALLRRANDPALAPLFAGLEGCIEYGTGQLAKPAGLAIAGKTGTAAALGRHYRHAWFAGYAPADAPEVAVVVFVERGAGGSDAAPLARAIFEKWSSAPAAPAAAAPPQVAVRLFSVEAPAAATVLPGKGECRVRTCKTCRETPVTGPVKLRPGLALRGACTLEVPGAERVFLKWPLEVRTLQGRLALVLQMPLEDYVAGVLAGEGTVFRSEESLKAMAVTIRTYGSANRGRHRDEGFDFCDTTHCQDLRVAGITERLRAAAEATEGEILWYQGSPAHAFYHRHCGGTTESAADVWPGMSAPYLRSQPDTYCVGRGRGEWRAQISPADLGRALGIPQPREVAVLRRSVSGRAVEVSVGGRRLSADALHVAVGRALGWNLLRSTLYDVAPSGAGFVFHGYGSGHGVGLCQSGAAERGGRGQSYRQILEFYFPGTVPGVGAQGFAWQRAGGERVDIESTQAAVDGSLVQAADGALREAERRAGFGLPFRPRVRVYRTVAAFRDATGEPGWVAASTLGRTVRMQPPAILRSRGDLEAVLLHEMLHLLLENRAHPATPEWFREGLALHLGGSAPAPGRGSGQMGRARAGYRAARTCVETLERTHGRAALIHWLERGLPPQTRCDLSLPVESNP